MSTKSILVNFNGCPSTFDSLMPDNGLANLAGSLMEEGHKTVIMDYSTVGIIKDVVPYDFHKKLVEIYEESIKVISSGNNMPKSMLSQFIEIDKEFEEYKQLKIIDIATELINKAILLGADFIGFKLWTGEGFVGSVKIAQIIKNKLPQIKLFAGGPHVDWFMESIFAYTDVFDVVAYGEGEETIKLLSDYTEGKRELSEIPNIIYKKDGKIHVTTGKRITRLDSLPEPIYDEDVYPAIKQNQKINFIMIDESRGCPNSCNFCIHPEKSGNKWREKNCINIIDVIEKISRKMNTKAFRLAGSNTPPRLRKDIAQELIRRKLGIFYASFGHVRGNEDYSLLHDSGCVSLAFGVESGSQKILDQDINKKVKIEDIYNALINSKQAGILAVASIIVPCPHDTAETIKETYELLVKTRPDSVTIQLPGLIPNAYWYRNKEAFLFDIDKDFMIKAMTYEIKLLLPPMLWKPLPYKLNGMSSLEMSEVAQKLSIDLEKNGILTGIGDFLLLIAKLMDVPSAKMRNENRKMFFTGDFDTIQKMLLSFNDLVKVPGGKFEKITNGSNRDRSGSS